MQTRVKCQWNQIILLKYTRKKTSSNTTWRSTAKVLSPGNIPWSLVIHVLLSPNWSAPKFLQNLKSQSWNTKVNNQAQNCYVFPSHLILSLERKILWYEVFHPSKGLPFPYKTHRPPPHWKPHSTENALVLCILHSHIHNILFIFRISNAYPKCPKD